MTEPTPKKKQRCYCVYKTIWKGIELEVRHMPDWMKGMDHIEIQSHDRVALPITGTGYRSVFVHSENTHITSAPVEYCLAWLDDEADSKSWKRAQAETAQLSLF